MGYFATNAQEAALKEIARQMAIANSMELLHKLRETFEISQEEYAEALKQLLSKT